MRQLKWKHGKSSDKWTTSVSIDRSIEESSIRIIKCDNGFKVYTPNWLQTPKEKLLPNINDTLVVKSLREAKQECQMALEEFINYWSNN